MIDVPLQHETPGTTEKFIKFRLSNRLLLSGGLAVSYCDFFLEKSNSDCLVEVNTQQ